MYNSQLGSNCMNIDSIYVVFFVAYLMSLLLFPVLEDILTDHT